MIKRYNPINPSSKRKLREAEDSEEKKSKDVIKDLVDGNWSGSNEDQASAISKMKGLAMSDTDASNEFMKKIDAATSKMGKSEKKENLRFKENRYHQSQLSNLLPLDQYPIGVKLMGSSGSTKQMNLSRELIKELQRFVDQHEDSSEAIFF